MLGGNRLDFIREEAPKFSDFIHKAAESANNEAEFRSEVEKGLDRFAERVGIQLQSRLEYTLADGRADAVFNRFIIEYEPPGSLRDNLEHGPTKHAVQQAKDYILGLSEAEGHKVERLSAVAFDGYHFIYVRYHKGTFNVEPPQQVNTQSTARFLTTVLSLSLERALIPENLVADFGGRTSTARRAIGAFYRALENPTPLTEQLYEQWKLFFSEVAGYEATEGKLAHKKELNALAQGIGSKPDGLDMPRFFFALHTYFSSLVKLIARLALESVISGNLGTTPFSRIASLEGEALKRELRHIEDGGFFRILGVHNLLEGDFFGWYLESFSPEVEESFKETLSKLSNYNPATVQADPFSTRDLLKALYHRLLPRPIRHDLGEYYTPDWLAERVINQLDEPLYRMPKEEVQDHLDLHKRVLDPACGSGTFLVLALRALKENLRRTGLSEGEILEIAQRNVVGIDLNPLAVLAARVNYLLALLDLLPYRRDEIEIPVYLADSILTPSRGENLLDEDRLVFNTVVGDLSVPDTVDSAEELATLTGLLEEYVAGEFSSQSFVKAAANTILPTPGPNEEIILRELYEKLLDLHLQGLDGIWARIIKNAFMPLFFEDFDYVVGNPPWINWESLPAGYRAESSQLWNKYGLFVHKGMDVILGKGKKDISTLMTVVVLDRYLRSGGKLAFVITQSVWKTSGAAQGFRRFTLPGDRPFQILLAEDLSVLPVFEGASTRTSIFVAQKDSDTRYPVPYTWWQKTQKGEGLGFEASLEDILSMTRHLNFYAQPVNKDDPTSPWLTTRKKTAQALGKVLGKSHYKAHAGVYSGGANAIYWLEVITQRPDGLTIVQNIIEGARNKVEQTTVAVEPELIYPLLRGKDVRRWRAKPSAHILMVQDPKERRGIPEQTLQENYPKTYSYLKRFEKELRTRAAFKRYFTNKDKRTGHIVEKGPYYSMFNVGEYTLAPWKVVWREQAAQMTAAVIGTFQDELVMPDHKLMLVGASSEAEAHYLCALINSSITRTVVFGYAIGIQMDTHIIEHVNIPRFNPQNPTHQDLARFSQEAHRLAIKGDEMNLRALEDHIDRTASQLWSLDEMELSDIHLSLAELQRNKN